MSELRRPDAALRLVHDVARDSRSCKAGRCGDAAGRGFGGEIDGVLYELYAWVSWASCQGLVCEACYVSGAGLWVYVWAVKVGMDGVETAVGEDMREQSGRLGFESAYL